MLIHLRSWHFAETWVGKVDVRQTRRKKEKLRRQRNSPYINEGKGDTLAQKSHEFPPPQEVKEGLVVQAKVSPGAVSNKSAREPVAGTSTRALSLFLPQGLSFSHAARPGVHVSSLCR
eukprot:scaffold57136_cov14-Tisochrysis_lutea.AAC.1